MNAPYHPIQTMADVMTMISQSELPEGRKRDLLSSIRRVCEIVGCTPASLRVEIPALRKALDGVRPAAHRITPRTFSNLRSLFATALKFAKVTEAIDKGAAKRDATWAPMVDAIAGDKQLSTGLAGFMNWCAQKSISPEAVDDAVVPSFLHWLETRTIHPRPRQRVREAVKAWNDACIRMRGWPGRPLTRVSFRPISSNLTWEALPSTLRAEAEAYLALRAEPDIFDADPKAPRRALAASTLRQQREHIRLAVSVLVREGMPAESLGGLADLVRADTFKKVVGHYHRKADKEPNAFVILVAKTLIDIARYSVGVPDETLKELKRLASMLPAVPFDLTEKNKSLLRQFESEDMRARLFNLPDDLIGYVNMELQKGRLRFVAAQMAVAIAILLVAPLRPENLTELNFTRHFKEPQGRRGKLVLYIPKDATKTKRRDLTFEFPPELAEPIRWYRREILPRLGGSPAGDLFVSKGGKRKSQETLSQQLTEILAERVGVHMTPQQFRHLAAFLYLEAHPDDFRSVTDLLGHAWAKTTSIYAGNSSRRASQAYGEHVLEQRRELQVRRRRRIRPSGSQRPSAPRQPQ